METALETIIEQKNQLAVNIQELIQTFLDNHREHELIVKVDFREYDHRCGIIRGTNVKIFIS